MVWKGVIIEESLQDASLLKFARIVNTRHSYLENEAEKGKLTFHSIEVEDNNKQEFINRAKAAIRHGWYMHICKNDRMAIIFRGRRFEFSGKEREKMEDAKRYGISIGILPEQMDIEPLLANPFG